MNPLISSLTNKRKVSREGIPVLFIPESVRVFWDWVYWYRKSEEGGPTDNSSGQNQSFTKISL